MIYLLDEELTTNSHSKYIIDIINQYTNVDIQVITINDNPTYNDIVSIVKKLFLTVKPIDIVYCPWVVDANFILDDLFNDLSDLCWVVVAAGNFNKDICEYSPARAEKVITVACLNKSGVKASLSNYSKDKELIWVPGTNYNVGWKNSSGTSISGAVYTAFLAESLTSNISLKTMLEEYSKKVFSEIQNTNQ